MSEGEELEVVQVPQPETALIVLGDAMVFQPSNQVLSVTINRREDLANSITGAARYSLETVHVVMRSKDINTLYDPGAIIDFQPYLKSGGEVTLHALTDSQAGTRRADEEELATLKSSLAIAGLKIISENEEDASTTITARNE